MKHLQKIFPLIKQVKNYNSAKLKGDLLAGLTVGAVFIPQAMAYAVIADLPPIYGLYAGLIPLLIFPIFTSSRHLSIGPVAIDMLILSAIIGAFAGNSVDEKITLAITTAFLTGIIQILMGVSKLGFAFNLFSRPVISGFTIAAPVIIISSQIGTVTGIEIPNTEYFYEFIWFFLQSFEQVHIPTVFISAIFLIVLLVLKKFFKGFPAAFALLIITIAGFYTLDLSQFNISQIGNIPKGLPEFSVGFINLDVLKSIFGDALTLALVQFMTVASLAQAFAKKHKYTIDPNKELIAIGSSNLAGSFFQSIPVSSSFSRSAINEENNAASSLSNIFTGALVLVTLLFLTPYFAVLPYPLLASIIIVSVSGLINIKEVKFLLKTKRRDALVALVTFMSILFVGIQEGIIIGIISSVLALLIKLGKPTVAELGLMPDTRDFKNIKRFDEATVLPGILILRVDASFSFINANFLKNYILEKSIDQNSERKYVILDGTTIGDLDISALDSLITVIETLESRGIHLYISGLIGPVRDVMRKSEIGAFLNEGRIFRTVHDAVEQALKEMDAEDSGTRFNDYSEKSA